MPASAKSGAKAPEQTFEEVKYLKRLIENRTPVQLKLSDDALVNGTIEYFDAHFLRLTRGEEPNLFIFKHDIKYLIERES